MGQDELEGITWHCVKNGKKGLIGRKVMEGWWLVKEVGDEGSVVLRLAQVYEIATWKLSVAGGGVK